ncbi:MAG: MoxR family ATPase [Spirochaetes bacterium]|jgi:MoxR-like ATPase|nr:MoxR family ATPase [Spirochaetota bacterium]
MEIIENIVQNMEKVIIGKRFEIELIIKAIIAEGHILIEDIPGIGKTTLVKALSRSIHLDYSRIQFTPDLLPSDITGISVYNRKLDDFEYKKGPVYTNILLADEINRTSPKTQSALLEVMEERQISEGGTTYTLDAPFTVLATQNPIEYEGTFKLPEAQLDRFLISLTLGYASPVHESRILQSRAAEDPLLKLAPVAHAEDILQLQTKRRSVHISEAISNYIVELGLATRKSQYISLGASTRSLIALQKTAQAAALFSGRDYVIPEDIRSHAPYVFAHRLALSPAARSENLTSTAVVKECIDSVKMPAV